MHEWMREVGVDAFSFVNAGFNQGDRVQVNVEFLRLCTEAVRPDKYVALGNVASGALRRLGLDHFKLPHPSGRNRLLNDPSFIREQLEACRAYVNGGI